MNNKFKPALIGGVFIGVLSVIPFVSAANLCCCLWAILGGMLATYLYVKNSSTPAGAGDGAVLGVIAGAIGAVISFALGVPIALAMGPTMRNMIVSLMQNVDPRQAEMMRQQFEAQGNAIAPLIIQSLIGACLLFVFAILGGLLGVPIFEKRKNAPPPPPAFNAGGGPGGYAA
ncbi:MAG TPA: DUF5518 domain-containing protein [Pyrinomonadaceae bacterium]|nr:DUF5518 domain-containing protein [Pyrinomonadaceae bacterium]